MEEIALGQAVMYAMQTGSIFEFLTLTLYKLDPDNYTEIGRAHV